LSVFSVKGQITIHSLVMNYSKLAGSHDKSLNAVFFFTLTIYNKFFLALCCNQRSHDKSLIFCKLTPWTRLSYLLSTLECLTNCETCVGCSSSLLWYVHKYDHVILKHGRTCWEGGVLWPSNRLYCSLCLRSSTCKSSLGINTSIEHSNSFQILNL